MIRRYKLQVSAFLLGLACVIPVKSFADDFEDVLDDLMTYRKETRLAVGKPETASVEDSLLKAEKQPLSKSQTLRAVPGKAKEAQSAASAKPKAQQAVKSKS